MRNIIFLLGIFLVSSWLNAQTFDFGCVFEDPDDIASLTFDRGHYIADSDAFEDIYMYGLYKVNIHDNSKHVSVQTKEVGRNANTLFVSYALPWTTVAVNDNQTVTISRQGHWETYYEFQYRIVITNENGEKEYGKWGNRTFIFPLNLNAPNFTITTSVSYTINDDIATLNKSTSITNAHNIPVHSYFTDIIAANTTIFGEGLHKYGEIVNTIPRPSENGIQTYYMSLDLINSYPITRTGTFTINWD